MWRQVSRGRVLSEVKSSVVLSSLDTQASGIHCSVRLVPFVDARPTVHGVVIQQMHPCLVASVPRNRRTGHVSMHESCRFGCSPQYNVYHDLSVHLVCSYQPIRLVGSGAYGVVCAALDRKTGRDVAIKKIQKVPFGDMNAIVFIVSVRPTVHTHTRHTCICNMLQPRSWHKLANKSACPCIEHGHIVMYCVHLSGCHCTCSLTTYYGAYSTSRLLIFLPLPNELFWKSSY